jgi:4-amino-4-deoxy-L-arabinose transferase-like glycosyltransferase
MFDTMLTAGVLAALLGLATAAEGRAARSWVLVALGTGFALHAKGPVAFVHILPAGLLAPWWALRGRPDRWGAWFARFGLSLLGGVALILAWAIPAALSGGKDFGNAIFLGQTAGRMVHSFAHKRPVWWYLPIIPAMVLPWLFWRRAWRGFAVLGSGTPENGTRFCLAWALPALIVFSLVSGKQMHYLLPLMPAFAIIAARALDGIGDGSVVVRRTAYLAAACVVAVIVVHAAGSRELRRRYDLAAVAAVAQRLERSQRPIAHAGNYAGQYHFLGRLTRPFTILHGNTSAAWLQTHPDGAVITDARRGGCLPVTGARLLSESPTEGSKTICVWEAAARLSLP